VRNFRTIRVANWVNVSESSGTSSTGLSLEVDWEAWEGRLGVLVRNFRTIRVANWVNVSESSGTSSTGLSLEVDWEAWEGRLGVLVRNLKTMIEGGIGSPGWSLIKAL